MYHYHNLSLAKGKVAIFPLTVIMVYSQRVSACSGVDLDDKRTAWMFFGVIALAIVNLLGWGRINHQIVTQGYLSEEFVVNWVAARALIMDGESPYQPEVTRTILTVLGTDKAPAMGHVPQFTSPIYTILLFLPFAFIAELSMAQTVWMSLQQVVLVVLILLSVYMSPAKPNRLVFSLLIVTTLLSFHALAPIYDGSTILLTSLFLLLSLLSIRNGREELGGVLLGLTTIQLPYMVLPIILILLWTLGHRKRLVALWFLGILILLTVLGIFLVREWPLQYLQILLRYPLYYPASSPGAAFRGWWPGIGMLMSWLLTILTTLVLLVEWWIALRGEFRYLLWVTAFTLVVGLWTGLPVLPQNLVLLLLPLILCVSAWSERWGPVGSVIAVISLIIILIWEWWLVNGILESSRQVDSLKLIIPLPIVCLIGLYWVRSMIVNPKRLLIDEIRSRGNA
jgi:hypothetical protein